LSEVNELYIHFSHVWSFTPIIFVLFAHFDITVISGLRVSTPGDLQGKTWPAFWAQVQQHGPQKMENISQQPISSNTSTGGLGWLKAQCGLKMTHLVHSWNPVWRHQSGRHAQSSASIHVCVRSMTSRPLTFVQGPPSHSRPCRSNLRSTCPCRICGQWSV